MSDTVAALTLVVLLAGALKQLHASAESDLRKRLCPSIPAACNTVMSGCFSQSKQLKATRPSLLRGTHCKKATPEKKALVGDVTTLYHFIKC